MKSLGYSRLYYHHSKEERDKVTNAQIRVSDFKDIYHYQELVEELAKISYYNPGYSFFYRGQTDDYTIQRKDKEYASSLYPTIYRKKAASLTNEELEGRYQILDKAAEEIILRFKKNNFSSWERMRKFPVLVWSVLQHYDVCKTPLLDVTHSARVAASFAFHDKYNVRDDGYFYVLALPNPSEGIACSVDHEMVIMKLLSVCPPEAKRPFYQEGYLVGNFPFESQQKHPSSDVAVRLVAKFRLKRSSFWDKKFPEIPFEALMPKTDQVNDLCKDVKERVGEK